MVCRRHLLLNYGHKIPDHLVAQAAAAAAAAARPPPPPPADNDGKSDDDDTSGPPAGGQDTPAQPPPAQAEPYTPPTQTIPGLKPGETVEVHPAPPDIAKGCRGFHPLVPCPLDPPHDLTRVRLACVLLDTCGEYFVKGKLRERLDRFLVYLQRFALSKCVACVSVSVCLCA